MNLKRKSYQLGANGETTKKNTKKPPTTTTKNKIKAK